VVASALVLGCALTAPGVASADGPAACLGPGIGRVLEGLVSAHAFESVAPPGYRLERLDVQKDHIELGYDDDGGPSVTVLLVVAGTSPSGQRIDARGPNFEHRVVEARGPVPAPARDAMLRAAMLVDRAISAEELARCEGVHPRASTALSLGIGAAQIAIIVATLVLGVAWRKRAAK
jgi:hypothetical protein